MAVYVDPIMNYGTSATWRWTHSCHMFADTQEELHVFAGKLALRRSWFQTGKSRIFPHYDLTVNKRHQAVRLGAVSLTMHEAYDKWKALGYVKRKSDHESDPGLF